jgi:phosphoribosylformylglycinamidine synthase
VQGSLQKLGFEVGSVRVGRVIDVDVVAHDEHDARAQVERMCSELLANPLIESVQIQVEPAS